MLDKLCFSKTSMLCRAQSRASSNCPLCAYSAPQQPCSFGVITSYPARFSNRTLAAFVLPNNTLITQPLIKPVRRSLRDVEISLAPIGGPLSAKRSSCLGKHSCGGLGKPLGWGEGEAGDTSGNGSALASSGINASASRANFGNNPSSRSARNLRRQQRQLHPPRKWKNFLDCDPPQKSLKRRALIMALDVVARVFQQITILHAARANRLARPAAQAQIDVPHRRVTQRQPPVLHRPHQVNAPARRIVLVARLRDTSGTTPRHSPQWMHASDLS